MRAKDVMTTPVVTVGPEDGLKEVAALLVNRGISAVPVVDELGELVGIVSEGDLVPLETSPDPRSRFTQPTAAGGRVPRRVSEVMTADVIALPPSADLAEVAEVMLRQRVKRVPIVDGDRVVGIVSRRDVLRVLSRPDPEVRAEVEELLDDDLLLLRDFRARVEEGVVTLSGPPDEGSRRLAEILARSVPGVVAVRFDDRH